LAAEDLAIGCEGKQSVIVRHGKGSLPAVDFVNWTLGLTVAIALLSGRYCPISGERGLDVTDLTFVTKFKHRSCYGS